MDQLRFKIKMLKELIFINKSAKEEIEIRAEIEILEAEYKLKEQQEKEKRLGVSQYGSYFHSSH